MKLANEISTNEGGYSLVESLVALAILLSVLVPSALVLTFAANNRLARDKMESFNLARNEMEYVLATENDSSSITRVGNRWWVMRNVLKDDSFREITVKVFKSDTTKAPVITLQTSRLWYKE